MLFDSELAALSLLELSVNHVVEHCRAHSAVGASPSTINHDVSYLNSVPRSAKPVYGIEYTDHPSHEARPQLL